MENEAAREQQMSKRPGCGVVRRTSYISTPTTKSNRAAWRARLDHFLASIVDLNKGSSHVRVAEITCKIGRGALSWMQPRESLLLYLSLL